MKRLPFILTFGILMIAFVAIGLWLDHTWQFLTEEGAFLSSRAIIAGRGNPASLQNIGLVYPPLGFYLAVPFTWLHLPHPAIWLSAAWGAGFTLWMVKLYGSFSFKSPVLAGLGLLLPFQPGIFHSAATGTTFVIFATLVSSAIWLVGRFAMDEQALDQTRRQGLMSAWINSNQFLNERVRYLWSAALCFGLAGFTRFDLLLGLLVLVPLMPLMLPSDERRDLWKITTLILLLYLPMVATQFIWSYLTWVFTDDFFYALKHPSTYFRQVSSEILQQPQLFALRGRPFEAIATIGGLFLVSFPVFYYLLFRLRNLAVATAFLTPVVVEGLGVAFGISLMHRAYLGFAGVFSLLLFLLCVVYRRIGRIEAHFTAAALVVCTAWSWVVFSDSGYREERVWKQLVHGKGESIRTFGPERELVAVLHETLPPDAAILMDDQQGYAVVTLSRHPRWFILPYQKQFVTALQNPSLLADAVALRNPSITPGLRDRVAERWGLLDRRTTTVFGNSRQIGPWYLNVRTVPRAGDERVAAAP